MNPLDRPVWHALSTCQRDIADGSDLARAFPHDIGPLAASRDDSLEALADLAQLVAARGMLVLLQAGAAPVPAGCRVMREAGAVQMVGPDRAPWANPGDALELGDGDAPEMMALAQLTEPGPFAARTHTLGRFFGIRIDGRLVAMAGERMRLDGYTEVSGVCTHPDYRGRGLAVDLCKAVIVGIVARGERPFLHSYASNSAAIRVYEQLGFEIRRLFAVKMLVPA